MAGQLMQLMIVDDHAMVRKGMKAFLDEYEGIRVTGEAANCTEAVQFFAQLNPDVIFIDVLMPGMDGIETIKRIIAIRRDQRIILLSAHNKEDKLFQAVRAGRWDICARSPILKNLSKRSEVFMRECRHSTKGS